MTEEYQKFLLSKEISAQPDGLKKLPKLADKLMPLQRDAVNFGLEAGRSALFLDCVHGSTLIPTSRGVFEIEDLAERGDPIMVESLTNRGIVFARSTSPFRKGRARMFRIQLASGREFIATARHAVMTDSGWSTIEAISDGVHLLESSSFHPPSISEFCLEAFPLNGVHLSGKPRFQFGLFSCSFDTVVSVQYIRTDYYYDLHVPIFENYCAEGFVHHNTGLGKTLCEIEFARHVPGRTLILAPLAVAAQTVREAKHHTGLDIYHSKDGAIGDGITVANYERLHLFDASEFKGVVLDESSILKSFMGKTKIALCNTFAKTPFRLAATATPAPNDYMELGNHSEFLGVMDGTEMLTRWFINDTMNFGSYRLKGHAEKAFWQWVASWAVCASRPSDMGHDDGPYELPPLRTKVHTVGVDYSQSVDEGMLFRMPAISATTMHREKRITVNDRVAIVAELCRAESDEAWLVWCESNEESAALAKAIPDAVEVSGADSTDVKEDRLDAFSSGRARVLVTKPSIAGFGLNFQHCSRVAFASVSYSYEQFYQAIRRSWRFGQKRPVDVHVVIAETETPIWQVIQTKLRNHDSMKGAMRHAVFQRGKKSKIKLTYNPKHKDTIPKWLTFQ